MQKAFVSTEQARISTENSRISTEKHCAFLRRNTSCRRVSFSSGEPALDREGMYLNAAATRFQGTCLFFHGTCASFHGKASHFYAEVACFCAERGGPYGPPYPSGADLGNICCTSENGSEQFSPGGPGACPPEKFLKFDAVKWHFLHSDNIF